MCFAKGSVVRGEISRGESLSEVKNQKQKRGEQPNAPWCSYTSSEQGTQRKNLLYSKQGSWYVKAEPERVVADMKK